MEQETNPPLSKLACVMVGLPARGKTYIARKVARYLTWLGHRSRIFNVGNYRRQKCGASQPSLFFDPENYEFNRQRTELADEALTDMLNWLRLEGRDGSLDGVMSYDTSASAMNFLHLDDSIPAKLRRSVSSPKPASKGGQGVAGTSCVALYDATNSTRERRSWIERRCNENGFAVMFIESICDDEEIILNNIKEVKLSSPDYVDVPEETAIRDFQDRIAFYAKSYQTLCESEMDSKYEKVT